jgi:UDP-GlcNAc3NAcA epimerase
MKKIITILGARPQFIKAAMVSRELEKEDQLKEIIVHTGQHYDINMSEVFFQEMGIPEPVYNLGVSGGGHGLMTGRMMVEIEEVLLKEKPDLTLLYGDTNSTLAGALVSRKLNIPVAHVEGGLRNFDMTIPEDVNRIVTDRLSDIIFCPTELAMENLHKEGFDTFPCRIIKTGDLMFDAVRYYAAHIVNDKSDESGYILCTIHRAHNTTAPGIHETFAALNEIAASEQIIFPVHPRTKKAIEQYRITLHPNIKTIEPQGYLSMVKLLNNSTVVITDSGGLQKEAYALGKKSLQLMDYTPWEELITNGFSVVTEISKKEILDNWSKVKGMQPDFSINLYGDGHTNRQIVNALVQFFN